MSNGMPMLHVAQRCMKPGLNLRLFVSLFVQEAVMQKRVYTRQHSNLIFVPKDSQARENSELIWGVASQSPNNELISKTGVLSGWLIVQLCCIKV